MKFSHYELYELINRPGLLWLAKVDLSEANLSGATLNEVNLSHANLSRADLRGTSFYNANLCDANLRGANLADTSFTNAKYNMSTLWPDGFNPRTAEAVPQTDD